MTEHAAQAPESGWFSLNSLIFLIIHIIPLAAIWTGVAVADLVLAAVMYALMMFGVTAGYHRYFSHRTYQTGRLVQFGMAWLAMSSGQKGILRWAANHRHHHRHSDSEFDLHSPTRHGFWWAHVGWLLSNSSNNYNASSVKDLARFPELRWLQRFEYLPPVVTGLLLLLIFGWSGLIVGYFWALIAAFHATFTINSLCHVIGWQRYATRDQSRNHWLLALITFGEGWHNNHHHFPGSTRQGFFWWEIDLSYYVLKAMSLVGLVSELREPPPRLLKRAAMIASSRRAHSK